MVFVHSKLVRSTFVHLVLVHFRFQRTSECRARRSASLSMLIVFPTWPRHVILVVVWSGGPVLPSRSGLLLDMAGEKISVSTKSSCNLQLKVETDHFG